jgi:UDP-N-acetyl-D-glucosamine dehydrogenase
VVAKTQGALNEDGKALKGSSVLVLGLSYKANIDDDRESPSYEIIERLQDAGAAVDYCDPHFPAARHGRRHSLELASVACDAATFARYDALVVSTAHDAFRRPELYAGVRLVVDARNLLAPLFGAGGGPRVVKA